MKTFKKTFKLICDSCGEFTHTNTQYCEKCGAETIRTATKEDYEKIDKAATQRSKESKKISGDLKKEDHRVKRKADKIKKEEDKAEKIADRAEWEAEREADNKEWETDRAEREA